MRTMRTRVTEGRLAGRRAVSYFSEEFMRREQAYGGKYSKMFPVVLDRAQGANVWDVNGCRYIDLVSGYATLNMGHSHPRLAQVMRDQVCKLALTSSSFFTRYKGELAEYLTSITGLDRFVPTNTRSEAYDTAVKIARSWGYTYKNIDEDKAVVLVARGYFCGTTLTALSSYGNPSYKDFGPMLPLMEDVPYDDVEYLKEKFYNNDVCAYVFEPIQYETGANVPQEGYLQCVRNLCSRYNVLMVVDESQTGMGRTGKNFAVEHEAVQPDLMMVGKALSGGFYPVSGVLGKDEMIQELDEGSHDSTFGGSPLGQRVALEALRILEDECLAERARSLGILLREELRLLPQDLVCNFSGRGLLAGLELNPALCPSAWDICCKMLKRGLLTRPSTCDRFIRLSPPLNITEQELREAIYIIVTTLIDHKNCVCT